MFFKSILLRTAAAIMTAAMLVAVGLHNVEPYDVERPNDCALHFSVMSDVHTEGNNYTRYKVLTHALRDVGKNKSGSDAVVFLGDNTMNGFAGEQLLFHGAVKALLRTDRILPALGNHDIGNGKGDYDELMNRWYTYTEAFFGRHLEHPYYCEVIDGYSFIILGTEAQTSNTMRVTDAQFTWLEETLGKAAESGKPAFVFLHHPTVAAEDENGKRTDRLTDMLAAYNREHDLFCFTGHTHQDLRLSSFRTYNGFPQASLPCLTRLTGEKDNVTTDDTGIGLEVEVYADEVVLRGRDFYRGRWKNEPDSETPCAVRYALKDSAQPAPGME